MFEGCARRGSVKRGIVKGGCEREGVRAGFTITLGVKVRGSRASGKGAL